MSLVESQADSAPKLIVNEYAFVLSYLRRHCMMSVLLPFNDQDA